MDDHPQILTPFTNLFSGHQYLSFAGVDDLSNNNYLMFVDLLIQFQSQDLLGRFLTASRRAAASPEVQRAVINSLEKSWSLELANNFINLLFHADVKKSYDTFCDMVRMAVRQGEKGAVNMELLDDILRFDRAITFFELAGDPLLGGDKNHVVILALSNTLFTSKDQSCAPHVELYMKLLPRISPGRIKEVDSLFFYPIVSSQRISWFDKLAKNPTPDNLFFLNKMAEHAKLSFSNQYPFDAEQDLQEHMPCYSSLLKVMAEKKEIFEAVADNFAASNTGSFKKM